MLPTQRNKLLLIILPVATALRSGEDYLSSRSKNIHSVIVTLRTWRSNKKRIQKLNPFLLYFYSEIKS